MKKTLMLMFLTLSILSCEKDNTLLIDDVPDWLRTQVSNLEEGIKEDPSTLLVYSAWVRYEWEHKYFFEFINPPSSFHPLPKCMDGENIDTTVWDRYEEEKCCMQYVWKGPKY